MKYQYLTILTGTKTYQTQIIIEVLNDSLLFQILNTFCLLQIVYINKIISKYKKKIKNIVGMLFIIIEYSMIGS